MQPLPVRPGDILGGRRRGVTQNVDRPAVALFFGLVGGLDGQDFLAEALVEDRDVDVVVSKPLTDGPGSLSETLQLAGSGGQRVTLRGVRRNLDVSEETMRRLSTLLVLSAGLVLVGCGSDEPEEIPNSAHGGLNGESIDWVVEGMTCEGAEVVRMVGLVDEEPGRAEYLRGDECVEAGDAFWERFPDAEGDELEVLVDSEDSRRADYRAEAAGDYSIRLVGQGEGAEVLMRQAYPEESGTPIPDLSDFELSDQWWMEGYPCEHEGQFPPQVVDIQPDFVSARKIVGDACIGDGQRFFESGQLDGTSISGEALLEEDPDEPGLEPEKVEASGTVYNDNYIRLDVAGQAVSFRRVMGEAER